MFYTLEPEVPGGWGTGIIADTTIHPPKIIKAHVEFDGWQGDELLESFPIYLVSKSFANNLLKVNLTGFTIENCTISKSETFNSLYPQTSLPEFLWLVILGDNSQCDLFVDAQNKLTVSQKCFDVINPSHIKNSLITETEFCV
jgi:hypothetical protein